MSNDCILNLILLSTDWVWICDAFLFSKELLLLNSFVYNVLALFVNGFLGDDDASSEPNWGIDCSTVVRVKELHISSPILAAKSPFFYKVLTFFSSSISLLFALVNLACNDILCFLFSLPCCSCFLME